MMRIFQHDEFYLAVRRLEMEDQRLKIIRFGRFLSQISPDNGRISKKQKRRHRAGALGIIN